MKKKQFRALYPRLVDAGSGKVVNYCGIRCSMEVLGGKWKLLLLSVLFRQPMRFAELRRTIPEISDKMLAATLGELEHHRLVERRERPEANRLTEYVLTEYGRQTQPLLEALYGWGEGHIGRFPELIFL